MTDLHTVALDALAHGLCPIPPRTDGTKAPGLTAWRAYQERLPTPAELRAWFPPGAAGIGLVCGQVSGGLEMLELEAAICADGGYDRLCEAARETGLGELLDRIACGYEEATPSGGVHWLYRLTDAPVPGNTKIAMRPAGGQLLDTLAETRGEGGFVVIAPSHGTTHPSGQPWELTLGGFDTIATITLDERTALHQLIAALFDERVVAAEPARPAARSEGADVGDRPGDRYNATTTWHDVLEPHGWRHIFDRAGVSYWRRPGKNRGVSATTNALGTDRLKVFTSSTTFSIDGTYDRFGAYAVLHHGGDHSAAARAVLQKLGPIVKENPPHGADPRVPPVHQRGADRPVAAAGSTGRAGEADAVDHARAAGDVDDGHGDLPRPVVVVSNRQLRDITTDVLAALVDANDPPHLYVRAGTLARARRDEDDNPLIEAMDLNILRGRVARVVDTVRLTKDGAVNVPPPLDVVRDLLALDEWPGVPALEAIVTVPTMRADGTIHAAEGYDPHTRLLHMPRGDVRVPPIPTAPTPADVEAARELVLEAIDDFPFEGPADRANTVALLLTPIIRPAIAGPTPLALIDAPEPGTGKGLLANVIALIATGHEAAMQDIPRDNDEMRKRITGELVAGGTVIVFDNIEDAIAAPALAMALTTTRWTDRVLGRSEVVTVPNRATWLATGNNLSVGGDLARRCYRIRIDAQQAEPWRRQPEEFRHPDLIGWVGAHRGELLAALLTMSRAWWAAGRPAPPTRAVLGGFTPWATTVGGILAHAGIDGFLGNLNAFHENADDEAASWEAFLGAWSDRFGERSVTVHDLSLEMDHDSNRLRQMLPDELGDYHSASFRKRLGHALRKRAGRRHGVDGLRVVEGERHGHKKVKTWRVLSEPRTTPQTPHEGAEVVSIETDLRGLRGCAGFSGLNAYEDSGSPDISHAKGPAETPQIPANPANAVDAQEAFDL